MNPKSVTRTTGYSQRYCNNRLRVASRLPELPCFHLGYREERDGLTKDRHLSRLAETLNVNVGGSLRNVKMSSPSKSGASVGAAIVV